MRECLPQTVPRIAYAHRTSNNLENYSSPSDTPETRLPPYTKPEKDENDRRHGNRIMQGENGGRKCV